MGRACGEASLLTTPCENVGTKCALAEAAQSGGGWTEGENLTIETRKADDSEEKLTIESDKMRLSHIEALLGTSGFNARTRSNVLKLYDELSQSDAFGRKDVAGVIGGSDSRAGDLLKKMLDCGIVVRVVGHGKGRYRFA